MWIDLWPTVPVNVAGNAAVRYVAERQYGLIANRQAVAAGVSPRVIHRRRESGEWLRVAPAVSAVGIRTAGFEGDLAAALLWAGPDASAAGWSAARLWSLDRAATRIEIVVDHRRRLRLDGVAVRRTHHHEITRRRGFPLTTVRRTLLDVCAHGSREQATDCVDEAIRLQLTSPDRLLAGLEAGRPGAARLRQLAGELAARTDSAFERRALELLRRFGLSEPERQRPFTHDGRGLRADFAWPAAGVVLECDGFAFHRTRHDLARDRWRRRAFAALGQEVVWITWDDVRDAAAFAPVAADLARRLGDRGVLARAA